MVSFCNHVFRFSFYRMDTFFCACLRGYFISYLIPILKRLHNYIVVLYNTATKHCYWLQKESIMYVWMMNRRKYTTRFQRESEASLFASSLNNPLCQNQSQK